MSKIKNACPDDSGVERTNQIIRIIDTKNGENLYMKTDVIMLVVVLEKLTKLSNQEYGINPLYCVFVCSYTYQCGLKYTDIKLQTTQDKDLILIIENDIRGVISSVMGDR